MHKVDGKLPERIAVVGQGSAGTVALAAAAVDPRITHVVAVDSLAALAATLGHDLEVGASQLGRGAFQTALFSADDGTMFLATSPIGFVVALAEPQVSLQSVRTALAEAVGLIEAAWSESARPPSP